jgi:hypothetical protein
MSFYPGGRDPAAPGTLSVSDGAMADSMALAIENAMREVFHAVKGMPLPDAGEEDRRILFVAVARGVLGYLRDHQAGNIATGTTADHRHSVSLNITPDAHGTQGH